MIFLVTYAYNANISAVFCPSTLQLEWFVYSACIDYLPARGSFPDAATQYAGAKWHTTGS